jgi:hypothetical protein
MGNLREKLRYQYGRGGRSVNEEIVALDGRSYAAGDTDAACFACLPRACSLNGVSFRVIVQMRFLWSGVMIGVWRTMLAGPCSRSPEGTLRKL